jgi:hypothetical protein
VLWKAGSDVPMNATLILQKRLGRLSPKSCGLSHQAPRERKEMAGTALRSGTWKTVIAVLLTSIPLAERMLLYHLATTALILLPIRPFTDQ